MDTDNKNFDIKNYYELVDTIARCEYLKLPFKYLIDFSDLMSLGTQVVYTVCTNLGTEQCNKTYLITAVKWAMRNEIRRRAKWYALKNKQEKNFIDEKTHNDIREAVYKTILSIESMSDNDNPVLIADFKRTPEEKALFTELNERINREIKKLPLREREIIEAKFLKDKKLKDIADEYNLSPSRVSRIIQSGLNKIRKELTNQNLV